MSFFACIKLNKQEKSDPMVKIFQSLGKPFLLFDADISDHLSRYLPGSRKWLHDAVRQYLSNSVWDSNLDNPSTQALQGSVSPTKVKVVKTKKSRNVFWLCADAGTYQCAL